MQIEFKPFYKVMNCRLCPNIYIDQYHFWFHYCVDTIATTYLNNDR